MSNAQSVKREEKVFERVFSRRPEKSPSVVMNNTKIKDADVKRGDGWLIDEELPPMVNTGFADEFPLPAPIYHPLLSPSSATEALATKDEHNITLQHSQGDRNTHIVDEWDVEFSEEALHDDKDQAHLNAYSPTHKHVLKGPSAPHKAIPRAFETESKPFPPEAHGPLDPLHMLSDEHTAHTYYFSSDNLSPPNAYYGLMEDDASILLKGHASAPPLPPTPPLPAHISASSKRAMSGSMFENNSKEHSDEDEGEKYWRETYEFLDGKHDEKNLSKSTMDKEAIKTIERHDATDNVQDSLIAAIRHGALPLSKDATINDNNIHPGPSSELLNTNDPKTVAHVQTHLAKADASSIAQHDDWHQYVKRKMNTVTEKVDNGLFSISKDKETSPQVTGWNIYKDVLLPQKDHLNAQSKPHSEPEKPLYKKHNKDHLPNVLPPIYESGNENKQRRVKSMDPHTGLQEEEPWMPLPVVKGVIKSAKRKGSESERTFQFKSPVIGSSNVALQTILPSEKKVSISSLSSTFESLEAIDLGYSTSPQMLSVLDSTSHTSTHSSNSGNGIGAISRSSDNSRADNQTKSSDRLYHLERSASVTAIGSTISCRTEEDRQYSVAGPCSEQGLVPHTDSKSEHSSTQDPTKRYLTAASPCEEIACAHCHKISRPMAGESLNSVRFCHACGHSLRSFHASGAPDDDRGTGSGSCQEQSVTRQQIKSDEVQILGMIADDEAGYASDEETDAHPNRLVNQPKAFKFAENNIVNSDHQYKGQRKGATRHPSQAQRHLRMRKKSTRPSTYSQDSTKWNDVIRGEREGAFKKRKSATVSEHDKQSLNEFALMKSVQKMSIQSNGSDTESTFELDNNVQFMKRLHSVWHFSMMPSNDGEKRRVVSGAVFTLPKAIIEFGRSNISNKWTEVTVYKPSYVQCMRPAALETICCPLPSEATVDAGDPFEGFIDSLGLGYLLNTNNEDTNHTAELQVWRYLLLGQGDLSTRQEEDEMKQVVVDLLGSLSGESSFIHTSHVNMLSLEQYNPLITRKLLWSWLKDQIKSEMTAEEASSSPVDSTSPNLDLISTEDQNSVTEEGKVIKEEESDDGNDKEEKDIDLGLSFYDYLTKLALTLLPEDKDNSQSLLSFSLIKLTKLLFTADHAALIQYCHDKKAPHLRLLFCLESAQLKTTTGRANQTYHELMKDIQSYLEECCTSRSNKDAANKSTNINDSIECDIIVELVFRFYLIFGQPESAILLLASQSPKWLRTRWPCILLHAISVYHPTSTSTSNNNSIDPRNVMAMTFRDFYHALASQVWTGPADLPYVAQLCYFIGAVQDLGVGPLHVLQMTALSNRTTRLSLPIILFDKGLSSFRLVSEDNGRCDHVYSWRYNWLMAYVTAQIGQWWYRKRPGAATLEDGMQRQMIPRLMTMSIWYWDWVGGWSPHHDDAQQALQKTSQEFIRLYGRTYDPSTALGYEWVYHWFDQLEAVIGKPLHEWQLETESVPTTRIKEDKEMHVGQNQSSSTMAHLSQSSGNSRTLQSSYAADTLLTAPHDESEPMAAFPLTLDYQHEYSHDTNQLLNSQIQENRYNPLKVKNQAGLEAPLQASAASMAAEDYQHQSQGQKQGHYQQQQEEELEDLGFGNASIKIIKPPSEEIKSSSTRTGTSNSQSAIAGPNRSSLINMLKGIFAKPSIKQESSGQRVPIRAELGEDNQMVYDPVLKKWRMKQETRLATADTEDDDKKRPPIYVTASLSSTASLSANEGISSSTSTNAASLAQYIPSHLTTSSSSEANVLLNGHTAQYTAGNVDRAMPTFLIKATKRSKYPDPFFEAHSSHLTTTSLTSPSYTQSSPSPHSKVDMKDTLEAMMLRQESTTTHSYKSLVSNEETRQLGDSGVSSYGFVGV